MSDADSLRAARESRADIARRASRSEVGGAMTRMVDAAVYRATHRSAGGGPPAAAGRPAKPVTETVLTPLGPDLTAAMRAAESRLARLHQSELRTGDGLIRYVDTGSGSPVLLVHGLFGGADAALRQLGPFVPDGFRIIAPSRFGYLGSTLPTGASPARQADAFATLLDELGIETTAVVASSAGTASALRFALRHPARVAALVLISSHGPGGGHERPARHAVARVLWRSDRLMWLVRHRFTGRLRRMLGIPADRARASAELDGIFPVTARADGALFDAFVVGADVGDGRELGGVTAPTLVVHARDDVLAPWWGGAALAQSIPQARLLVVEDGGHLMLGAHPEVTAQIRALLRSTVPTVSTQDEDTGEDG